MKTIGPSFAAELGEAGLLGLTFSWTESGAIFFGDDITGDQQAAVLAVVDAHDPETQVPPAVPGSVTKYQCCVVLARHGLLVQTDAFFAAMAVDDPRRLAWEMAGTVTRFSDSTLAAIEHLEISPAQADAMFTEAGHVA